MTRAHTVLQSIVTALQESDRLPDATSYSTWELDEQGGQSNVRPPIVEVTPIDVVRARPHNTDFVGYATNNAGEQIGYIFHGMFEMPVQIDIWTAEGDRYDPRELGRGVRYALYRYDEAQYDAQLPDPDDPSKNIDDVERFVLNDGTVANDLTMTPALRRWRQTAEVWFHETINTAEEYGAKSPINTVQSGSGDVIAADDTSKVEEMTVDSVTSDGMILFDATPGTESAADQY